MTQNNLSLEGLGKSLLAHLADLPEAELRQFLAQLTFEQCQILQEEFIFKAHPHQMMPLKMQQSDYYTDWLILGGRGSGKTRAGAENLLMAVRNGTATRIALVGQTLQDVADIMILGESGIINCAKTDEKPIFSRMQRKLIFPNGAEASLYSAKNPDSLRGPQFDFAWCDEFAKWRYPERTRDMLSMAMRLGQAPKQIITTTPKPLKILRDLVNSPTTIVTHAPTRVNAAHLAPQFMRIMQERYQDTRLGRQELEGILYDDMQGALWSQKLIEDSRIDTAPPAHERSRIIVSVDPPISSHSGSDECGIIVACTDFNDPQRAYILADLSGAALTPAKWAQRVVEAYYDYKADRVVAEINQGGEMVKSVIETIDRHIPFKGVFARRGKISRAEPVAALYEKGIVHHVGFFEALENQMCCFTVDHIYKKYSRSPDRVDALVWALTELMLTSEGGVPKIYR